MTISREELVREWLVLKDYGLTDEEIQGMMEFFDYEVESKRSKRFRFLKQKNRPGGKQCTSPTQLT